MELAIKMSAASKGAYKGEYSVSSGEVIDSDVLTQTHIHTNRVMTSNGPEIAEITSSSSAKTVFWVRFDSGRELKYTINSEIDLLKGQRVSLLFINSKANTRLVGIANHNSNEYTDLSTKERYASCLRPNKDKLQYTFAFGAGLLTAIAYMFDEFAKGPGVIGWIVLSGIIFIGCVLTAFLVYGPIAVLFGWLTDLGNFGKFKSEVKQNLIKLLTDGANQ
ncbi:hypothetical protein R7040_17955 [Vibrio sp. 1069]|uniref:hypothetical protein n=1 Tax=unclassified Vibrio TaxID=2614977 RepID=UPI0029643928|nr:MULTISPECIES: hypothetical protein [unclassified Vibrio]MDW1763186.1 hypothetical protein [Vibrio sp. Vb2135]MDW2332978.1 hypothetical protein [Vibrio sp. 1069]